MKICPKCEINKPKTKFARNVAALDGVQHHCRQCTSEYMRARNATVPGVAEKARARAAAWAKAHPAKHASTAFRRQLKHKYGMTVESFETMRGSQNGLCKICSRINDGKRLFIDHDHATGKVRGLLCNPCNMALGAFREDPSLFTKAIAYLESTY